MYASLGAGCDAVVFLVFNKFDSDCKTQTYGHEFGGVSDGGMCDQNQGKGYTVVVDQVTRNVSAGSLDRMCELTTNFPEVQITTGSVLFMLMRPYMCACEL